KGDADGGATLGVVAVHQGVDDGFPQHGERNAPDVLTAHGGDFGTFERVFLEKQLDTVHGQGQVILDIGLVEDVDLVGAAKAPALNPGIVKVKLALRAEQQHGTLGGHQPALVAGQ